MKVAIITGSNGLIGSECVSFFADKIDLIIGIDNDMRSYYFGYSGSTRLHGVSLSEKYQNYKNKDVDIRDYISLEQIFKEYGNDIELIIHTAAQPSHDWAAKEPITDFNVNALGTLNLLELCRKYCPNAVFIFTSTNKVYGDSPNSLPLIELGTRYELPENNLYWNGVPEQWSIDDTKHSIFGVSKASADLLVQEYGKYFGMKTGVFRGGCLSGSNHMGAPLHGFLSYLVKCAKNKIKYTVYGYKGKQVRDNIHAYDVVTAFNEFYKNPKSGVIYNIGGGRKSNCSILEAAILINELYGTEIELEFDSEPRIGDHQWYITDMSKFKKDYPQWEQKYSLTNIIQDIYEG